MSALLAREAASLVARLRLWTPARWSAAAPPWGTRGDLAYHLAAQLAADCGQAPQRLPRLDSDLALPDQLAVTADDLVRGGRATGDTVAHLLLHRRDLLGDPVPPGVVTALGEWDEAAVLARGRRACAG